MICKNKLYYFILISLTLALFTGCSTPEKDKSKSTNSIPNNETKISDTVVQSTSKETDLLSYIGKSKDNIKNIFGEPTRLDGTEKGEIYDYGSFSFGLIDNKVSYINITNSDFTVNRIQVGMTAKKVTDILGAPTKETNDDGFILEYKLNSNGIAVQYCFDNFSCPMNSITVIDLNAGKEKPMEVTTVQVAQLMNGTWIPEEYIYESNLNLFKHGISNGVIDTHLSECYQKTYEVTSNNTIIISGESLNIYASEKEYAEPFFVEFFNDGDKMVLYHLNEAGDIDIQYIYIRYFK